MITNLAIKNFAIIKDLSLEFGGGLNIITGETGAGKSIIIEAVNMALGARADSAFVRTGCDKALIQLVIEKDNKEAVILSREISSSGRSSCRINDVIVTLATLHEFCLSLVDLHGQYDNQALLNPDNHVSILDSYDVDGGISLAKENFSGHYREYSQLRAELISLKKTISDNLRKKDFMEFELGEINRCQPSPGEDSELASRISVIQNREKICSSAVKAHSCLYSGEGSCTELLSLAASEVEKIAALSPKLADILTTIREASCSIEDAASELAPYTESEGLDEADIDRLIERLNSLETLKRKFGGSLEAVIEYRDRLSEDLSKIENFDYLEKQLRERLIAKYGELEASALILSEKRKEAALSLENAVNTELSELNFKNSHFKVMFEEVQRKKDRYIIDENGIDVVEFFISTNKGEELKPMAKIASGGEISRIMLAFKKILGDYSSVPTFIFDEIDTGISGHTAAVVARKLADIAKSHQVLCITHLPQIAVMGDQHYLIQKMSTDTETCTQVNRIGEDVLVSEIARLSGNISLSSSALANAREMIEAAKAYKD